MGQSIQNLVKMLADLKNQQNPQEPKGYYGGGMVGVYEAEQAKKRAEQAELDRVASNEEGIMQAKAMEAFARSKAQQEGKSFYDNSVQSVSPETEVDLSKMDQESEDSASLSQAAPSRSLANSEPSLFSRISDKLKVKQESGDVGASNLASRKLASKSIAAPLEPSAPPVEAKKSSSPYGDDLNDEALKSQQNTANFLRMAGMLGNAGSTIGSALSRGVAKDVAIGDDTIKGADQGVKNLLQRREGKDAESKREKAMLELNDEKAASDPNSSLSKTLREGLKTVIPGLNIPEGASALQLKNMGFNMGTLVSAKIAADARVESAAQRKSDKETTASLAREKFEENKKDKAKLEASQLKDVNELDSIVATVDSIISDKSKFDTGKASFGLNAAASWLGLDDADKSAFKADVGDNLASYIKNLSGTAVGVKERANLMQNIPSVYDNDKVFNTKAQALKNRLLRNKDVLLTNFEKNGKDVTKFKSKIVKEDDKSTTSNVGSNQDKAAIEWAKSNKSDPRAKQILKLHGLE